MNLIETKALRAMFGDGATRPEKLVEIIDETKTSIEDFQHQSARDIWFQLEKTVREGVKVDATVISMRLPSLRSLIHELDDDKHVGVSYVLLRALHEQATRRRYFEALRVIANMVTNTATPLAGAVVEAQKLLADWQDETATIQMMDSSVFTLIDEIEAVQSGKVPPVLQTGIEAWDAMMGGLQPTLTMVGAAPGVGKSALVAGMLPLIGARGVKVGLISLEDERGWLTRRLMSHYTGIPVFVLANKKLFAPQKSRLDSEATKAFDVLTRVACDDRSGLTGNDVVASARRMIAMGCKAIFVDHLGEISIARTQRHDLDISDVLRDLRVIAKVARVPVIVLAHMKRSDRSDGEPHLSDFAFSAGVERMARVAVGLWRDGDALMCSVLKQTQGISGVSFELNMNKSAGIVIETPASAAAKNIYNQQEN